MRIAYCFSNGHLYFGTEVPLGAFKICDVPNREARLKIQRRCWHPRYNKEINIIPNFYEFLNPEEMMWCIEKFKIKLSEINIK